MILVDTSVWIDHFRMGNPALIELLESDQVLIHPFVIGELACGTLKNRSEVLRHLNALPAIPIISQQEVLGFIDKHALSGKGIGLVDAHLLASTALSKARLWSRDRKLLRLAIHLEVAWRVP